MKINLPWLNRAAALGATSLIKNWMSTLDYKAAFYDQSVDPTHPAYDGPKIYVFWHEYILLPLYLRGHNHLTMLLSQHRDADIMEHVAHFMGFGCVRGSTTRGGSAAIKELIKLSQTENLTITPDGPKGPRRQMAQGPIYLASKLQLPLVVMGYGYDRPWRLKSWDRFAIPRPYSRARLVMGPQIHLPSKLDRDGLEHYRIEMERMMNRFCSEAEAWAESGTAKLNEVTLHREPMRRPMPTRAIEMGKGEDGKKGRESTRERTPISQLAHEQAPSPHHSPAPQQLPERRVA